MHKLMAVAGLLALCGCPERSAEHIDVRMAWAAQPVANEGRTPTPERRLPQRPAPVVEQVARLDQVAQQLSRPVGATESVLFNLHHRLHADLDVAPAARRLARPPRAR